MARIKIDIPKQFSFTTPIAVRITDLNYGGHVGNDAILSLIHEARVQFLRHHGYTELDMGGVSLIMGDVAIEFKSEIFYGDSLRASVAAGEFSRVGFDLFYKLESSAAKPEPGSASSAAKPGPGSASLSSPAKSASLSLPAKSPSASAAKPEPGSESSASASAEKWAPAAFAKTGMVCFNYTQKKVVAVPEEVLARFKG